MQKKGKRTPIGLDIGASAVRAVQLLRSGRSVIPAAVSTCAISSASEDEDRAEALAAAIGVCLRQGGFRGRRVISSLNPPDVQFHALELPPGVLSATEGTSELDSIVRGEIERLRSDSDEGMQTRHWRLPSSQVPAPNAIGAAATTSGVETVLHACQKAGTWCSAIDAGAVALSRLGSILRPWDSKQVWGVLDVGARESRLTVCVDDVPTVIRAVGAGGRAWTERIAESLQISVKAAEVHKCDHGLTLGSHPHRRAGDHPSEAKPSTELGTILAGILRSDLTSLAGEIKRSYEYVLSCYPSRHASDLIVTGRGGTLQQLPEFLSNALGIPVRRASTYPSEAACRLRSWSRGSELDEFALAMGLAIPDSLVTDAEK